MGDYVVYCLFTNRSGKCGRPAYPSCSRLSTGKCMQLYARRRRDVQQRDTHQRCSIDNDAPQVVGDASDVGVVSFPPAEHS